MAIQLDAQAFKALSSSTRVALLKKLGVRPRSLSSLAQEAGLSVQATDEHMQKLVHAGLVKKEKKTKWAYYHLTVAGQSLVAPERQPVYLMLAVSFMLLLASAITFMQTSTEQSLTRGTLLPEIKQASAQLPESTTKNDVQIAAGETADAKNGQTPLKTPLSTTSQASSQAEQKNESKQGAFQDTAVPTLAPFLWPLIFAAGGILSLAAAIHASRKQKI